MPKRDITWDSILLYLPQRHDPQNPERDGYSFFVRKIYIDPLVEAKAQVKDPEAKRKYFLPHPEGDVNMHFAFYAKNFDWEEDDFTEGVTKEGLFWINMKLMTSIDDPSKKYVQVYVVDRKVPPEKVNPKIRGEFFVTYSRTIIRPDKIRRFNHLVLPHRDDFIVYSARDILLKPLNEKGYSEDDYETEILLYYAFRTELGRYHLLLPETKVDVVFPIDYQRDPLTALMIK